MKSFGEAMEEVLRSSKYNYLTGKFDTLGEKLMEIVKNILEFILNSLLGLDINIEGFGGADPRVFKNIFLILAIVVAAVIASLILRFLIRRKKKAKATVEIFDEYMKNTLTLTELLEKAMEFQKQGDFRQALRYRYIALITVLDKNGYIKVSYSMTGGQFIREVEKNALQFSDISKETVAIYYEIYFGYKSLALGRIEAHSQALGNLIKEAGANEK